MNAIVPSDRLATAVSLLLDPVGLDLADLGRVLGVVASHRADYADIYLQYTRSESWSLEEGLVKSGSFSIDSGAGVRVIDGERTAFAYTDDLCLDALLQAARTTRSIAVSGGSGQVPMAVRGLSRSLYPSLDPLSSLDADAKVAMLLRIEQLARASDPRIRQVMASLAAEYDVVLLLRADGRVSADVRPLVRVSLQVIAEAGGQRQQGSAGSGGRHGLATFDEQHLRTLVDQATHQALVNLEAGPAPAGEMTVVLGPGWPGILLHEAIGHGLEGDFNRKGSSAFSGRLGERIAASGVTVVDDGTLAGRRGSLNVDDEGEPTQRTVLIEDGILKGYIQDQLNARLMGVTATGNGRRESYAHVPLPRMTNTCMVNGDREPGEIIASVEKGLYAVNFGGGQVDITSGKFVFSAAEAYLIEHGRVTRPVRGATLIGNGPDVLTRVSMIGNDMALDPGIGTCGKDGQSVPVGVGQPTLRIDGLTVGGTA